MQVMLGMPVNPAAQATEKLVTPAPESKVWRAACTDAQPVAEVEEHVLRSHKYPGGQPAGGSWHDWQPESGSETPVAGSHAALGAPTTMAPGVQEIVREGQYPDTE